MAGGEGSLSRDTAKSAASATLKRYPAAQRNAKKEAPATGPHGSSKGSSNKRKAAKDPASGPMPPLRRATRRKKAKDDVEEDATAAMGVVTGEEEEEQEEMYRQLSKAKHDIVEAATAAVPCDDNIVHNILARLPARTLVASTTLSKHHRHMILCPEFRSLHCRLGPPLSLPQIGYIAAARIKGRGGRYVVSEFHSFHVAGGAGAPTRSLTGPSYVGMKYINSCHGVLLLANSSRCVFWNPCVANSEQKEVMNIPGSTRGDCVLGFGYGTRTRTYKLLIARKCANNSYYEDYLKDLLVYSLGDAGEQQPQLCRTVLSGNQEGEGFFYKKSYSSSNFFINSLYTDGIVYLLHVPKRVLFAFDVDDETVVTINLPGNAHIPDDYLEKSRLMEVLGRPCIETDEWKGRTLWMLTVDHQWEHICVFDRKTNLQRCSITGAWDCGGVVVLHMNGLFSDPDRIYLFCPLTKEIFCTKLPPNLKPQLNEYAFCWGYKPTLVSPGSVVGELSLEKKKTRGCTMDIFKPLEPLNEQEKRKGQQATLTAVCLMEFLAGVMRRLPENLQQVIQEIQELRKGV